MFSRTPHRHLFFWLSLLATTLAYQNCSDVNFALVDDNNQNSIPGGPNVPNPAVICDPFGSDGTGTQGLAGKLRYFSLSNDTNYLLSRRAYDYVNGGIDTGVLVIMRRLNVDLRSFTEGFPMADGQFLKDNDGNRLIEFFGIEFTGKIRLTDTDAEAPYQFGLDSDDGTRLEVMGSDGKYDTLIDHDGNHGMQFKAANRDIVFNRNTVQPIRLLYYQGPRNEIGLRFLWKRSDAPDNWHVVGADNLVLPDGVTGCP